MLSHNRRSHNYNVCGSDPAIVIISLLILEQEAEERMGMGLLFSPILLFPKEQQENNGLHIPDEM